MFPSGTSFSESVDALFSVVLKIGNTDCHHDIFSRKLSIWQEYGTLIKCLMGSIVNCYASLKAALPNNSNMLL